MGKVKMKIKFLRRSFLSVMRNKNNMIFGAFQKACEYLRLFFVKADVYLSPNGLMQFCWYINSCLARNTYFLLRFKSPMQTPYLAPVVRNQYQQSLTAPLFLECASMNKNIPQALSVHYCFCGCGFYLFIIISVTVFLCSEPVHPLIH